MRMLGMLVVAITALLTEAGERPQRKVLVELFTSQGCSSCPPAEARLSEALKGDLAHAVVLTWNVNYWDYLGWADSFASRQTTLRQEDYVRAQKLPGLLTPQFFINGRALKDSRALIEAAKEFAGNLEIAIELTLEQNGTELRAEYKLARADHEVAWPRDLRVLPVLFQRQTRVTAKAGENRGRELSGVNVVRAVGKTIAAGAAAERKHIQVFEIPPGVDAANLGVAILIEDPATLRSYGCESR